MRGILPFQVFPIKSICCTLQGLNTPKHLNTHPNPINIHTLHPYAHNHLLQVSRDNSGQQQTPTDTKRQSQAPQKTIWGCVAVQADIGWHLLVSIGVFRCLTASFSVLWCLKMWGGCLRSFSKGIWVLFMDVFKVWVPLREHLSVQALYGAAIAFYWKISKRQNSTHSAFVKHQNTKPPYIGSLKIIGL